MDTTSHIIIGLGLGAFAQIDPVVAESSLSHAVIIGTVFGSNAPDFDCVFKLNGNGSYYRNHRGWSHSLPALPLWSFFVSGSIYTFFPGPSFFHLFFWTFLAVVIHVLLDLFNVYGTQVFRPFSAKWIAFDSIPLIDPYILMLHIVGFALLPVFEAGKIFSFVYLLMALYILIRTAYAWLIKKDLEDSFRNVIRIKLIPRAGIFKWDLLIETEDHFLFGVYSVRNLIIELTLSKKVEHPELVRESRNAQPVSDFLASTNYAYPFVQQRKNGYFVYWKDLRFRTNKFFPYLVVMFISSDLKSKVSYIGWLHSLKQYKKVLRKLEKNSGSLKGKETSY
ncbi:metal-dependent hydrolase [Peribacillus cavernae]|uniref:Metal-dependent hydrolase n=1 Tax=Peribacillus cavernae TaxID=1674310 RepID=A0A3S0UCS6_9BACI|nr:metal-dependent hydrolase [Peribacillus cavernae]MDQ0219205.1 inner membrane protein [Peribacillus cavernae]RUQ28575.1 metal-dependent hydrolase [Peribacillus cavernae]